MASSPVQLPLPDAVAVHPKHSCVLQLQPLYAASITQLECKTGLRSLFVRNLTPIQLLAWAGCGQWRPLCKERDPVDQSDTALGPEEQGCFPGLRRGQGQVLY